MLIIVCFLASFGASGADPAGIPFYQVSKFDLSINLKTAKTLGLTVPDTLLATAAKVVE